MRPRERLETGEQDLLRSRLDRIIDHCSTLLMRPGSMPKFSIRSPR